MGKGVEFYTINGTSIVQTGLSKGSVAIVKIGTKSVKVIVD